MQVKATGNKSAWIHADFNLFEFVLSQASQRTFRKADLLGSPVKAGILLVFSRPVGGQFKRPVMRLHT